MIDSVNWDGCSVTEAIRPGHRTPRTHGLHCQKHASRDCLLRRPHSAGKPSSELLGWLLERARRRWESTARILRACSCKQTIRSRFKTWLVTTIAGSILLTATQPRKEPPNDPRPLSPDSHAPFVHGRSAEP